MALRTFRALTTAACAVLLATTAAHAASPPTVLPTVTRTVSAPGTAVRTCNATASAGQARGTTTYTGPMSGSLDVRLAGTGDWDLVLRSTGGRVLAASQGFGGREVAQKWVAAGDKVVAEACRRKGATGSAKIAFRLADVKPPTAAEAAASLVRVHGTKQQVGALDALGLDVTESSGDGWADVIVPGAKGLEALRGTGLPFDTRIADLTAADKQTEAADRAYGKRVGAAGSPLPTGRSEYRTLEDYQSEIKALVEASPDRVRKVSFGTTFQGRPIEGVEIADGVRNDDGRPIFFLMGIHHAREWPSGEAVMEFAHLLADAPAGDARLAGILRKVRVVLLPIVNADGFVSSRSAFDPGDSLAGGDPNATLVEAVAPPGGLFAYRRKNCDGEIGGPEVPCELAWGVDNNRNYGNLWGGPGSSSDVTSQSYHGPGPRSEPETQAVWDYARTHNVTTLISMHNVAALVLRPPGLAGSGLAPDETRMKELGDAMANAAGYTSQFSWQLYDTAGTTEDDTYAATGGYGYTIEMGPPGGNFHMPYETGVVKEWTGANDHSNNRGGLKEALLLGAESAGVDADHAIVRGTAPEGRVLRLHKAFQTTTSPYCEKGVEPVVSVDTPAGGPPCPTPHDPQTLDDTIDLSTTVPTGGAFDWHVNQSTRPFVGGGAVKEQVTEIQPPLYETQGAPGQPTGSVDHEVTLPADQPADQLVFHLTPTAVEDYDLEVYFKQADGSLQKVASSGNLPGAAERAVVMSPQPGTYVARVIYYAAATGSYTLTVNRATATREVTTGTKEAYALTCETPAGDVLESHTLIVDRGQQLALNLGCGAGPSTFADGTPLGGAPAGTGTPSIDGQPAPASAASSARAAAAKASGKRAKRLSAKQRRALAACNRRAAKLRTANKRAAAKRSCARKYAVRIRR